MDPGAAEDVGAGPSPPEVLRSVRIWGWEWPWEWKWNSSEAVGVWRRLVVDRYSRGERGGEGTSERDRVAGVGPGPGPGAGRGRYGEAGGAGGCWGEAGGAGWPREWRLLSWEWVWREAWRAASSETAAGISPDGVLCGMEKDGSSPCMWQ